MALLAPIFWLALLLGVFLAIAWRFVPPGRLRTKLQITGSLFVFLPQLLILFCLYQCVELLLYQEALLTFWMLGVAAIMILNLWQRVTGKSGNFEKLRKLSSWRKTEQEVVFEKRAYRNLETARQNRNPAVLVIVALLMGGGGVYKGKEFMVDVYEPRILVEGQVEKLTFNYGSRAPRLSTIVIANQTFSATRDLNRQLHRGDRIRAEVGAGSRTVLRWERE